MSPPCFYGCWDWLPFVGLLSGLYPALYLSSISPLSALAESQKGKKGSFRLREFLVLTQFTVSVIVIACTCIMALQMHYVSGKPLGFSKENRMIINLRSADVISKYPVIKTDLLKNSHILGVAAASVMISTDQIRPARCAHGGQQRRHAGTVGDPEPPGDG